MRGKIKKRAVTKITAQNNKKRKKNENVWFIFAPLS